MMMRALLAYDASAGAEEAASLTVAMPWPPESNIRVVAVIEPSATAVPTVPLMPAGLAMSPQIDAQIAKELDGQIQGVVDRLRAVGIEAGGDVLRGRAATALIDEAQRFGADLVIAGSRGHGTIASLALGSVSAELVDHAPCPVLVARGSATTTRRVLLAADGSPSASDAEGILAQWPIFAEATVRVVSVAEVVRPLHTGLAPTMYRQAIDAYAKDLQAAKSEHEDLARQATDRLGTAGRTADFTVRVGDAAAEILEEASSWQADLVVLGSRGRTGISRLLLGSIARNVLQGSPSSVLIVRHTTATPPEVS
jgi:nucleotide-binding universal stress UspA family protein